MSFVDLAPGHIAWRVAGENVASVKVQRDGDDLVLTALEFDEESGGAALLEALCDAVTAQRMRGTDPSLARFGFEEREGRWVKEIAVVAAPDAATRAVTLGQLERAIRASWCAETSDRPDSWTPENPAYQQCDVTSRVVRDYLGGEILVAGVVLDGRRVDRHAWNRLPSGLMLDLTREQFRAGEQLEEPAVPETLLDRHPERYALLAERVRAALARGT